MAMKAVDVVAVENYSLEVVVEDSHFVAVAENCYFVSNL